jgi:subtilisin family serine protease
MRNKLISCVISIALLLSGMAFAQSPRDTAASKIDPGLVEKFSEMKADEQTRVIIEYAVPDAFNNAMKPDASHADRRNAVKLGRDEFLDSKEFRSIPINRRAAGIRRTFRNGPLIVFTGTRADIEAISRSGKVKHIIADRLLRPSLLESTATIGMPQLLAEGHDGSGQAIAILDSGVEKTHPFFGNRVVAEACFSTTEPEFNATSVCPNGSFQQIGPGAGVNCNNSIDGCDHGTHVAGIAAGANGPGFSGVAPGASIISVQVYSRIDNATQCTSINTNFSPPCAGIFFGDIIAGLDHVLDLTQTMTIASVNLSFGDTNFTAPCPNAVGASFIASLQAAGVAVVAASGNDGLTNGMSSPACIPSAISVGSTVDSTDTVAAGSNSASFLDLLAPGAPIQSSVPPGAYANISGTSQAAPHVAGAFAVLKAAHPGTTTGQILTALKSSGVKITDPRNGIITPRIDVAAAHALLNSTSFAVVPLNGFSLIPVSSQ